MIYAISLLLAGAQAVPPAGVNTLAVTDDPATEAWHTMLRNHAASQGRTLTSQVVSKQEVDVGPQVNLKGERHTGTFFMEALIQHNFAPKTCPNTGGFEGNCAKCAHGFEKSSSEPTANTYCCWAHGYANAQCAGFTAQQYPAHVFLTRSPYTWALAMHAQPYEYEGKRNASFAEFIRGEFCYEPQAYRKDHSGWYINNGKYKAHRDCHYNPIQLYNAKLRSYMQFMNSGKAPAVAIKYEDIFDLDKLNTELSKLHQAGIKPMHDEGKIAYPPFKGKMWGLDANVYHEKTFKDARQYEEDERWRDLLTYDDIKYINGQLDPMVMKYFNQKTIMTDGKNLVTGKNGPIVATTAPATTLFLADGVPEPSHGDIKM